MLDEKIVMNGKCFSLLGIILALTSFESSFAARPADSVFVNGEIYAGNVKNPWSSAFAVDGEKIVYVGDDPSPYIDAETKVYDLGGQLVIPGIIDAHSHPGLVALSAGNVVLDDATTKEELMLAIENMVSEYPDRQVLMGGFWLNGLFDVTGPRKEDLDEIAPNRQRG